MAGDSLTSYTKQFDALAAGKITAKTGKMDELAKQELMNIYKELSNLHDDLIADVNAVASWEGADKEAFKILLAKFQETFESIGKTLQVFGKVTSGAATDYASTQATIVDNFNSIQVPKIEITDSNQ